MCPVLVPAFLQAVRLLLALVVCGWVSVVISPFWNDEDKEVHLFTYSPTKSFHLQIKPGGRVNGAQFQSKSSAMRITSDSSGYRKIFGVNSRRFLCMHSNGRLYGSRKFSDDCTFKYHLLNNRYDIYVSVKHNLLVSLGNIKGPYIPHKELPPFSKFLPISHKIPLSLFDIRR